MRTYLFLSLLALTTLGQAQDYTYYGQRPQLLVPGAIGTATRLDGYSNYLQASFDGKQYSTEGVTLSLWCAIETYPMMSLDIDENVYTDIAGNIDDQAKTGMAIQLSNRGNWQLKAYANGWLVTVTAPDRLPKYQWNHITAVINAANGRKATLYLNGEQVAQANCRYTSDLGSAPLIVGKGQTDVKTGDGFLLNAFNGIIDEVQFDNKAWSADDIAVAEAAADVVAGQAADLAYPKDYWQGDLLRPTFHGMPSHGWTNECHGMTYSDGKYHLFFQKNGNGPYMSRLHWGHIVSENLYDWQEVKTAIDPAESYDIKGCWSGCVAEDADIFGQYPAIIYTGVDYGKAMISFASPVDATLLDWTKASNNPRINGRPSGLSDDFRDPYFFRTADGAYIIVGTSKNNIGACTLHKYNASTKSWSNDGSIFFQGTSAAVHGTFWEMPNVTPMGDGRWLFTVTPQNTAQGVRTLYWVGTIDANGQFQPSAGTWPKTVELSGMARDGYGLLSPTIYQSDSKTTIALGIVPDKVATSQNYQWGWAHCYSLPRQWSLSSDGSSLIQQPYQGLAAMRVNASTYDKASFVVNGTENLTGIEGREVEVCATFQVGTTPFGISLLGGKAKVTYTPQTNTLQIGSFSSELPESIPAGSELKLQVFLDHSVLDVFINDRWASSVRLFCNDADAKAVSLFADASTQVVQAQAWNLDPTQSAPEAIEQVQNDCLQVVPDVRWQVSATDHSLHLFRGQHCLF